MKNLLIKLPLIFLVLIIFACGDSSYKEKNQLNSSFTEINDGSVNKKQYIIIKADDLRYIGKKDIINENWKEFIALIISKKIKSSIGIITNSLNTKDKRYGAMLKNIKSTGLFEFWIHGYTHRQWVDENGKPYKREFCGTSYEFQKEHIQKSIELGKEKLGITFHTFGAPFNCIDDNTLRVIDESEEIKVWLYGDERSSKFVISKTKNQLERGFINENGKFDVDIKYADFVINYDPQKPYYILQIHPKKWDLKDFENFEKTIDFLKSQNNVEFITPYEYYKLKMNL